MAGCCFPSSSSCALLVDCEASSLFPLNKLLYECLLCFVSLYGCHLSGFSSPLSLLMKLFGCRAKKEAAETATMASKISRKLKLRAFSTLLGSLLKPKKAGGEEKMNEFVKKRGAVRLKLVLTKKEAAQLLAMYVRGEEEMVDKLVGELENSSAARRTGSSCGAWRPMLESIPED